MRQIFQKYRQTCRIEISYECQTGESVIENWKYISLECSIILHL